MKIGIITLPLHNNYGGILQAYALQKVLQNMGHDATVIDKSRIIKLSLVRRVYSYFRRFIKKVLIDKHTVIIWDKKHNTESNIMRMYTYPFLLKHIKRVELIRDYSEIKEGEYQAFVVGSDQIWRPMQLGESFIDKAFLSFTKEWDVKRVSYAASFGSDEWEYSIAQTINCGSLLKKFNAVSVREDSAVGLCKKHFGIDALHVLDPTMLLSSDDYIRLFQYANTPASTGTLMCYILDNNKDKENLICHIANELNLKAFAVNSKYEIPDAPIKERIQPPVECWLRGFYDAEMVFTDSFHGCVFSIIFNKPFWVIENKERGNTRFDSLLRIFNLEDRKIDSSKISNVDFTRPIDWALVNSIKKEWQEKSTNFLKENL